MSAKYDIESFVNDIVSVLKADLPAKISAINTEKGDFNITSISNDDYFDDIT